jgi:hypothetical protein
MLRYIRPAKFEPFSDLPNAQTLSVKLISAAEFLLIFHAILNVFLVHYVLLTWFFKSQFRE